MNPDLVPLDLSVLANRLYVVPKRRGTVGHMSKPEYPETRAV